MSKVSPKKIVKKVEKKIVKKNISIKKKPTKTSKTISHKKSTKKKVVVKITKKAEKKVEKKPVKKLAKKTTPKTSAVKKPTKTRKTPKKEVGLSNLQRVDLNITQIFVESELEQESMQESITSDYFESIPSSLISSPLTSSPLVESNPASNTQTAIIERIEIATIEEPDTFETVAVAPGPTSFEFDRLIELALKPYDMPHPQPSIVKRIAQGFLKIFTTFARKLPDQNPHISTS